MRVTFHVHCRVPLGRQLEAVLSKCAAVPGFAPRKLRLTSRQSREDLPIEEVLRSAVASASDSCDLVTDRGAITLAWLYGPRRNVPRMWGTLDLATKDLSLLKNLLEGLVAVTRATYGVSDLEENYLAWLLANQPDVYRDKDIVSAFHELYWWNYFGPEFSPGLPVGDEVRNLTAEVTQVESGGLIVVTRPSPSDSVNEARVAALAREWAVFRKYDRKAGFQAPIRVDYSQVCDLPAPVAKEGPIRDAVGPPDEFIASVTEHAQRFQEWARSRKLSPEREGEFLAILQEHDAEIRDELLVPAIAAYGELVRARMDGVWRKSVLHRGEPVVMKRGKPWTARRVILEVLEGMEPGEL